MFKLDLSQTYKYPVEFSLVNATGQTQIHKISVIYKRLAREAMVELNRNQDTTADRSGTEVVDADLDYLLQFVDGWEGVADNAGEALLFNRDNLRALLNAVPSIHTAITSAFFESAAGGHKRKN